MVCNASQLQLARPEKKGVEKPVGAEEEEDDEEEDEDDEEEEKVDDDEEEDKEDEEIEAGVFLLGDRDSDCVEACEGDSALELERGDVSEETTHEADNEDEEKDEEPNPESHRQTDVGERERKYSTHTTGMELSET